MVTSEEIGARAYELLSTSNVATAITGMVDWERNDYSKEDVVIVPHTMSGEGSTQLGQVNINIHVPDAKTKPKTGEPIYHTNWERLVELRAMCIEVLKSHYESGYGWNWTIGQLNPPIKEPDHNEHFVSIALEITARNKQ
jgi:hypothetical protein